MTQSPNTAPPGITVASTRKAIDEVTRLIATARQHVAAGQMVALPELEARCKIACRMAASLPQPQGRQVRGDLEAVLYDLDALETEMTGRFGALARRPLAAAAPHPQTVGAAYQAGLSRAAQVARQRPASPPPESEADALYPPSAAPPPASSPAQPEPSSSPATPGSPRRGWTL